jgi:hypothetical protein
MNEYIISFLETLNYKLNDTHFISLLEYEKFNKIKNEWREKFEDKEVNKNNNMENKLSIEKIKILLEKIKTYTLNKKEYEFISNYFLNENDKIRDISSSEISFNEDNDTIEEINENNIENYINLSLLTFKDINNTLENNNNISSKKIPKQTKSKKSYELPSLKNKNKNDNKNNRNNTKKDQEEIEKEMEEELNNQIFKYTKMMKISAKNFGNQLIQDNKVLNQIENLQNKDLVKTRNENQRLQEFNSLISLGFFKKLLLIFIVIITFVFTLLIMRIFPRLA